MNQEITFNNSARKITPRYTEFDFKGDSSSFLYFSHRINVADAAPNFILKW